MRLLIIIIATFFAKISFGQNMVKFQANIGTNFPSFNYSDQSGNSIKYVTQSNSDLRFGLVFKSDTQTKIALGVYGGIFNISSHTNNPVSTVDLSIFNLDLFVNYEIGNTFLQSVTIGPNLGFMTSQKQTNENQLVDNEGFSKFNFGLYTEINLVGFVTDRISANPYLYYRSSLSNLEGMDSGSEKSGYSSVGLGLKISI